MDSLIRMVIGVLSALAISGAIFLGLNYLVDRAQREWRVNGALLGLGAGFTVGAVLGLLPSFVGADDPWRNLVIGGVVVGLAGAVFVHLAGRTEVGRNRTSSLIRTGVFFGPAVLFLSFTLIVPTIRTAYVSLQQRGEGGLSFGQYSDILGNSAYFGFDGASDIITSRLTIFALWCVALGLLAGLASTQITLGGERGRQAQTVYRAIGVLILAIMAALFIGFIEAVIRDPNESAIYDVLTVLVSSSVSLVVALIAVVALGFVYVRSRTQQGGVNAADMGAPISSALSVMAVIAILLAIFSTLTGVVWNNLWWVAAVAGLSTILGLLIALLADRSHHETLAKSFIFMPMAISMVGAAVIWDFIYTRTLSGNQIGLFNSILVALGYEPRGFFINASLIPWNNFFIMIIMIWIQTGFAMVILSAAIKGVPTEFMEAARVDGATEVQIFWRITLPTIMPTIFVVLTTLIITVMKVFDLVKATTNGANGTDVLANAMFNDLRIGNFPRSAAFAVLIFVLVLPVMVYNVRRTAAEVR